MCNRVSPFLVLVGDGEWTPRTIRVRVTALILIGHEPRLERLAVNEIRFARLCDISINKIFVYNHDSGINSFCFVNLFQYNSELLYR